MVAKHKKRATLQHICTHTEKSIEQEEAEEAEECQQQRCQNRILQFRLYSIQQQRQRIIQHRTQTMSIQMRISQQIIFIF